MSTNDELYGEGDRQLIAILAALVQDEESTPQAVLEAASAIHDWVDVDARLAELTADPVLTRGDESALAFAVGSIRLRVEIEPAGYRRRRLVLVAHDEDTVEAAEVISAAMDAASVRTSVRSSVVCRPCAVLTAIPGTLKIAASRAQETVPL